MDTTENEPNETQHFSTKMGVAERRELFLACLIANRFNVSATCRDVGISRWTFYDWKKKNKKFARKIEELKEECGDMVEQALLDNVLDAKDVIAQIFYCKTKLKKRGYIEGNPVDVQQEVLKKTVELLDALLDGSKDVKTVALEFEKKGIPLPGAVKILLTKEPVDEDFDDDMAGVLSEEELEERGRVAMEDHNRQVNSFVPERKVDVDQIKEELKDQDSFSEENVMPEGEM